MYSIYNCDEKMCVCCFTDIVRDPCGLKTVEERSSVTLPVEKQKAEATSTTLFHLGVDHALTMFHLFW